MVHPRRWLRVKRASGSQRLTRENDRSLGASVRHLRKQRGLRREDFEPAICSRTLARIEQGVVTTPQAKTREAIARRLGVAPEELGTY